MGLILAPKIAKVENRHHLIRGEFYYLIELFLKDEGGSVLRIAFEESGIFTGLMVPGGGGTGGYTISSLFSDAAIVNGLMTKGISIEQSGIWEKIKPV